MLNEDFKVIIAYINNDKKIPLKDDYGLHYLKHQFKKSKLKDRLLNETEIVPTKYLESMFEELGIDFDNEKYHDDIVSDFKLLESKYSELRFHYFNNRDSTYNRNFEDSVKELTRKELLNYTPDTMKKPKTKIELIKALLPFFMKYPKLFTWDELYQIHYNSFQKQHLKPSIPKPNIEHRNVEQTQDNQNEKTKLSFSIPYKDYRTKSDEAYVENEFKKAETIKAYGCPWKSKSKIETYANRYDWTYNDTINELTKHEKDTFDMKKQRKLMKHFYAPRFSFIIDHMQAGDFVYLLAININTRKLYYALPSKIQKRGNYYYIAEHAMNETGRGAVESMKKIMNDCGKIKYIISDDARCFLSNEFQYFLKSNDIKYQNYIINRLDYNIAANSQSRPVHSYTSLIDRVMRTIRLMAYTMERTIEIEPNLMEYLVNEYNNSPHSTLSKYLKKPTSPNDVDKDVRLEEKLIKCIMNENLKVELNPEYKIEKYVKIRNEASVNDKVKPKLLPGVWEVVGKDNGLLIVKNGNTTLKVNRWQVKNAYS